MKIIFYEPQCKGIEHLKFFTSTIMKNIKNAEMHS